VRLRKLVLFFTRLFIAMLLTGIGLALTVLYLMYSLADIILGRELKTGVFLAGLLMLFTGLLLFYLNND